MLIKKAEFTNEIYKQLKKIVVTLLIKRTRKYIHQKIGTKNLLMFEKKRLGSGTSFKNLKF